MTTGAPLDEPSTCTAAAACSSAKEPNLLLSDNVFCVFRSCSLGIPNNLGRGTGFVCTEDWAASQHSQSACNLVPTLEEREHYGVRSTHGSCSEGTLLLVLVPGNLNITNVLQAEIQATLTRIKTHPVCIFFNSISALL